MARVGSAFGTVPVGTTLYITQRSTAKPLDYPVVMQTAKYPGAANAKHLARTQRFGGIVLDLNLLCHLIRVNIDLQSLRTVRGGIDTRV